MKKLLFFLIITFAFACTNIKEDPEYLKLQLERDSLAGLANTDAGKINQYLADFNDIQSNLDKIKEAEKLVTVNMSGTEVNQSSKDQINSDMQLIYDLMQKNKETIAQLKRKLKKSDGRMVELEKMIENLQKQVELGEQEIASLKDQLEKMNIKVEILTSNIDSLTNENINKENVISAKTDELNTAWYVYGTRKELSEHQVITKEGGFIGIGRMEKLMDGFNKDYFTKVDITKLSSIPLNCKKAHLVTSHPSSSYKFEGTDKKVEKLVISNSADFWSTSKYLVIVVE
ncbi:MAG: hypothetical protein HY951_03595 [Bacteroidia bacterium]|nr:hypothetical protein [Bacteroidia bacterium]